ncbi:hypothetical protein [Tenggerimyces flavus]|uniref:Uncharacterized protein n=1 Tax=Tenggerimyces flavus TaxID=1708749 RepID=A0ABV7YNH9_9ACTN|nr:hypothetical protein [Tenggerimyces flavus]MBM7790213.1 hypothetical protein [Tenggerimyces flavus]
MSGTMGNELGPITAVRETMTVLDARNEVVGEVSEVKMGDPAAVTEQGQTPSPDDMTLVGQIASAFGVGGLQVPDQEAARLLRIGYVKINRRGILTSDIYVGADEVDRVEGNRVYLSTPVDR